MILYESLLWFLKRAALCLTALQIFCLQQSSAANLPLQTDSVQRAKVSGKVTDIYNKPLTDVSVKVKGQETGIYTDLDGFYEIEAKAGSTLVFSVVGYNSAEGIIASNGTLNITLTVSTKEAASFHTLFTDKKKHLNTGAVTEIYTNDLLKTQTPWVAGLLQGRVAGLYSSQTSGQPGADGVELLLRGQSPLVWVDGVPQSFASISPEQIESITVLKDAVSTAMLGIRGANGLIQITTKQGAEGPQRIAFTALSGIQTPLSQPKYLNAYDYSRLYNEALANDGKSPVYSQADLDAFRNGTDPLGHPDVDWQKEILKKNSPYSRYDLSISGGRKIARYFVNLDYLDQQGALKTESFNKYNTGSAYKRYGFRTNVDIDLSDAVSAFLNVFTRIQTTSQPGVQTNNIFSSFRTTPNNAYPVLNSNGSLGGNQDYINNIYGQNVYSGYRSGYTRDFRVDLGMKGKLDAITPGLWIKGRVAINAFLMETITRSKPLVVFQETTNALGAKVFQQFGTSGSMSNVITPNSQNKRFYTELSTGYNRTFGDHQVEGLLMGSIDNVTMNSDLPLDLQGISGKASYNFKEKYLFDVAFAYNGSQQYPRNKRYGFFPAVGLGWNMANEDFLKDQSTWLNTLKLRVSYGKSGNNNAGYYEYNKIYNGANGYNFGEAATPVSGVNEGAAVNPYITWEKALKLNAGVDIALFKNTLSLNADYFSDKYSDLLQFKGNNTELLGTGYSRVNIGKQRYSGVELQLNYQNNAGDFHYFISPNAAWSKSKVVFQDEVARNYSWMQRTGQPVGQSFGYISDGLFQSTQEIEKSALPAGVKPVPGDVKYRDLNGDGVIDDNDRTAIGGTKPQFFYGVNIGGSYKGFDISALFQGVGNRQVYLSGNSYWAFQGGGKEQAYEHNLNRWTPENAANATYPRLTVGQNVNNEQFSSYWFRSANYLRLKSVELGYSLPVSLVKRVKLSGARFFVNGYNLFTTTTLEGMDPEGYNGGYPVQKLITAGVNIKL